MSQKIKCDIAIIGAGSGGLSVAAVASQLGLKVILIEGEKMGGDCLNTGCVPSKSLLAAAKCTHHMRTANKFGIKPHDPEINFVNVMESIANVIKQIAPHDSIERFTQLGVHVISAHAKFINPKAVIAGDNIIQARRFIIATGSSPALPPITGLDEISYLTNETIFSLREKPEHLIIIGGGPIGCEIAQAFLFLGIPVTILEAFNIMPHDDTELVAILRNQLKQDNLTLHEQAKVLEVKNINNKIEVIIEKNGAKTSILGSHLLVAAGRIANVNNLGLEKANITFTAKGVNVDNRLRTTNKRVYAIGDAAGSYQFTHVANYHAGVVIRNVIFKKPTYVNYKALPWVTYTSPELAHVGLSEKDALEQDPQAKVITMDLSENDRAQAERETTGKIKLIVTSKGKVLGVSILSSHAGELITPWTMMINENKSLRSLTDIIIPYPTLSEINKQAASQFYLPKLFSKSVRRLVFWLKYL